MLVRFRAAPSLDLSSFTASFALPRAAAADHLTVGDLWLKRFFMMSEFRLTSGRVISSSASRIPPTRDLVPLPAGNTPLLTIESDGFGAGRHKIKTSCPLYPLSY
jgi:hypothetical protein